MQTYDLEITLLEEALGTASANPDIYREFIESKRPPEQAAEDETESLPTVDEEEHKGMTVFRRTEEGRPFVYDYQIKGFFKDACGMLRRVEGACSKKITNYKKQIDGLVFVSPRRVVIELPAGGEIGKCVRPLRAQTAKGERVSLACSETVPPGSVLRCQVKLLTPKLEDAMLEWLEYGELRGFSQWCNSGKGRFTHTIKEAEPVVKMDK